MGNFYLIAGSFVFVLFTILRFVLVREKDRPKSTNVDTLGRPKKFLLSSVTFFQILSAAWIVLGILFITGRISYPKGTMGVVIDALLLLGPIWVYAFYLESKEKRRSSG